MGWKVSFLLRYWRPILIIGLSLLFFLVGSGAFLLHGVMSMLTTPFDFFLGEHTKASTQIEIIQTYKKLGNEYGVYWPDLAAYDTIHTRNDFTKITAERLEKTLKTFTYYEKTCRDTGSQQKCTEERRFYTLKEVLEREQTAKLDIEYACFLSENMLTIHDAQFQTRTQMNPVWITPEEFLWPVPDTGNLTSSFGYRINPLTGKEELHKGIDIANGQSGIPVVASAEGTIIHWCDDPTSRTGRWIRIQHANNYQTRYLHMERLAVSEQTEGKPTQVKKGQIIGYIGSTGQSMGPHLHFEIRKNGELFDPLQLVENTKPTT